MRNKKIKILYAFAILAGGILGIKGGYSYAADTTLFTQSINGILDVSIVDASGNTVTSPTVAFSATNFSMSSQTSTGTLGTNTERIRVTNPTATATWTASIAATDGSTAIWDGTSVDYDFNDPTANAGDGSDTDSVGGQMSVDPATSGNIAGVGGTSTSNVSLGAADSFEEGVTDSIDLMSAASGAQAPGQWDLTSIGISQSIPGGQATGSYSIDMTITVS